MSSPRRPASSGPQRAEIGEQERATASRERQTPEFGINRQASAASRGSQMEVTLQQPPTRARVASLDTIRGLVMVVMALDHVRDFTNRSAMLGSPTDLTTATSAVFLTRWVTHMCAPTFALTAGLGAWLWLSQAQSRAGLTAFLATRGLWLAVLEITVMQILYYFSWPTGAPLLLLVLWSLGLSMVLLAGLAWLPRPLLLAGAGAAILLNPLLGDFGRPGSPAAEALWTLMSRGGLLQFGETSIAVPYPLIPWAGVTALGFCMGPLLHSQRAGERLLVIGGTIIVAFVLLRLANDYGDQAHWSRQGSDLRTLLSFLNVSKYPASPAFLLMTLGLAMTMLGALERTGASSRFLGPLAVLGSVPLFFYLLHFLLAHLLATAIWFTRYGGAAAGFAFKPYPSFGGPVSAFPGDFGLPLWGTYCAWLVVVAIAYPACRWYAGEKQRRGRWWLRYL